MGLYTQIIQRLDGMIGPGKRFKLRADMARACEVPQTVLSRHLDGERGKGFESFFKILENLNVRIVFPEDMTGRDAAPLMHDRQQKIIEQLNGEIVALEKKARANEQKYIKTLEKLAKIQDSQLRGTPYPTGEEDDELEARESNFANYGIPKVQEDKATYGSVTKPRK